MSKDPEKIRRAFQLFKRRFQWTGTLEETQANPLALAMLRALANTIHDAHSGSVDSAFKANADMVPFTHTAHWRAHTAKRRKPANQIDGKRLAANDKDD